MQTLRNKNMVQKQMLEAKDQKIEELQRFTERQVKDNRSQRSDLRSLAAKLDAKVAEENQAKLAAAPLTSFEVQTKVDKVYVKAHRWEDQDGDIVFIQEVEGINLSSICGKQRCVAYFPKGGVVSVKVEESE